MYIWLVSNFKPVEVSFARILDEEDKIELIGNQEEKEKIFQAFRQQRRDNNACTEQCISTMIIIHI